MDIISRADWGARPPKHVTDLDLPARHLILHHAAGSVLVGDDTVSDADLKRIRSIQNYHMDNRGWSDIAYNWLMDPDGNLFEGRGTNRGGATKGYNSVSIAICVMGNYDSQPVDDDLVPQLARFARFAHDQGWVISPAFSGGHRDYGSTSCPGSKLYPLIHDINREATMALTASEEKFVKDLHAAAESVNTNPGFLPLLIEDMRKNLVTMDELQSMLSTSTTIDQFARNLARANEAKLKRIKDAI